MQKAGATERLRPHRFYFILFSADRKLLIDFSATHHAGASVEMTTVLRSTDFCASEASRSRRARKPEEIYLSVNDRRLPH